MQPFTRRNFLIASAAVAGSGLARATDRGMQLHLSCGALGIKATQKQAIDLAAKIGFDVVDADGRFLAGLSPSDLATLLDYAKSNKIGWAMAGLPVEFRRDDAAFSDGMKSFPSFAQGLQRAGVGKVTTWIMPTSAELTYIENFHAHARRLGEVARVLEQYDIRLGIEYVGPKTLWASQKYPFIHNMAEMKELFGKMDQPNVGFVLDSWHWYTSGETKEDLLTLRGKDIVSVDLNDAPSGIPVDQQIDGKRELPAATGVIDIKTFLGSLEKIGYDGPVRAEPFNEAVRQMPPDEAASAALQALQKAFAE